MVNDSGSAVATPVGTPRRYGLSVLADPPRVPELPDVDEGVDGGDVSVDICDGGCAAAGHGATTHVRSSIGISETARTMSFLARPETRREGGAQAEVEALEAGTCDRQSGDRRSQSYRVLLLLCRRGGWPRSCLARRSACRRTARRSRRSPAIRFA